MTGDNKLAGFMTSLTFYKNTIANLYQCFKNQCYKVGGTYKFVNGK